ncbi:PQQ-binding-like beta-propeller repeat protein [Shewanella electrodiphila]|uniref:PQQ-binding-like beta-propeller repeat protein n=1 Tax=Shewanella electrodiphila TaxID=934143 RepID=A0ABT0KRU9_9GAMM|nr:PQQ-binding-like beta-propeller repeat protein [Shewanella electrodiphila]MCL1046519.1 PQQ-binding-like beta-propeller repeat protein [Shewanella electrodiphila]
MKNTVTITLLMLFLLGCGGGGGESSEPSPQPQPSVDTDSDGLPDDVDKDDDGDGVDDDKDAFPLDASESVDTDGDGIGNNADTDDDNDTVLDDKDAFPLDASESVDTDGDGIGNNADTDDDGDGVHDDQDAFPLDAAESIDTDGDGIGNNADTDDDGDGIVDEEDAFPLDDTESIDTDSDGTGDNADFFPGDASCFAESDGVNEQCFLTWMAIETPSEVEFGNDGLVYLSGPQWGVIHRYDTATEHFLTPIPIALIDSPVMGFVNGHSRLYYSDDDGDISYIDGHELVHFTTLETPANQLVSAGNYLLTLSGHNYYNQEYASFNISAEASEQNNNYFELNSASFAWSDANSKLYHFRDDSAPNDLISTEIDQSTGQITQQVDSPHHGDYVIRPPISVSLDGSKVLLGSGDIYDGNTLEWTGSISSQISDAFWLADNTLVTVESSEEVSYLVRRDAELIVQEYLTFDGDILASFSYDNSSVLIVNTPDRVQIQAFVANDDIDNDGVINTEDAFASNPAFSKDSDNDGFADEVNEGVETDAELLALVDAFPEDSACWLTEHGLNEVCDFNTTVPDFLADDVVSADGVLYLLSAENQKVYTWNTSSESYDNPINLKPLFPSLAAHSANKLAYSAEHQRLYVGFESGEVHSIEPSNTYEVQPFTSLSWSVNGLASVGNYVLAQDSSGAWVSHHIFNQDGVKTDSKDWNYFSHTYAWNSDTSRVYFLRDDTSPNDLHYEEIDQSTGVITSSGDSPYHSSDGISHPVRVSSDNTKVILGSGKIFNASTLEQVADLGLSTTDIRWIGSEIFSLSVTDSSDSVLSVWSGEELRQLGVISFSGMPVALEVIDDDLVVVTEQFQTLSYTNQVVADHDNDGIPGWWEQIYGLDDSNQNDALLDSDNDGISNLIEYSLLTDPTNADSDNDGLSDGDEVNGVQTNPLNSDSDGDGLTDGEEVNDHGTDPLNQDSDADGLNDYVEVATLGTNPLNEDSDADGIPDSWEVANSLNPLLDDTLADADNDGLSNADEFAYGTDPSIIDSDFDNLSDGDEVHVYLTLPMNFDTDDDRMSDGWEVNYGFNPQEDDAQLDFDADGFLNIKEYFYKTNPIDIADIPTASPWSSLQGNASHNGLNVVDIDVDNLSERWTIDIPLNIDLYSDKLMIADNYVLLTGSQIENYGFKELVSFNALDGTTAWQRTYQVDAITPAAYSDGKVYFQTGGHSDSFLRALDINSGDLVFKSAYENQWTRYAAPTIFEDGVYVGGGYYGGVYRFDANSGEEIWFREQDNLYNWTPTVDNNSVYMLDNDLHIIDKENGELVESIAIEDNSINGETAVLGLENDLFLSDNNELIAIDLSTKSIKWNKVAGYADGISVGAGEVYVINHGVINALDSRDGSLLWAWEADNNQFLASNIVVSNSLLFVSDNSMTYALDLDTHQELWSIAKGGMLSLGSEGALYILDHQNRKLTAIDVGGDVDDDGMLDWYEDFYGFDKYFADDALLDADLDGLSNLEEFVSGTSPVNADSDEDGLTDYDELNIHLSNPKNSDTDADGMPDNWEIEQGFNLLDPTDSANDSDGDTITNFEEYWLQTDPNDINSAPHIITSESYSFEDQLIPDSWSMNASLATWYVDDVIASDGTYSLYTNGEADISFMGYFAGNELSFKVQSNCAWASSAFGYDDNIQYVTLSNDWQQHTMLIPRGIHHIYFYNYDNCTLRIDDVQFTPLQSLAESATQYVSQQHNQLSFFDYDNQVTKTVEVPYFSYSARDIEVLDDGRIAVFNGVFAPSLSLYDPERHTWESLTHSGWGIVNNSTYGGIDSLGSNVFVTDMNVGYDNSQGIVKFDLVNQTSEHISGAGYFDLSIGLDGNLYALSGSGIDIYNPNTMELDSSVLVQDSRAVTADGEGNMYLVTWSGDVLKYDVQGVIVETLSINAPLIDININQRNELLITDSNYRLIKTSLSLDSFSVELEHSSSQFISDVPVIDQDLDGMPSWWEHKYGLSDLDSSDASIDLDLDGLNNLVEYHNFTNPAVFDTDDDQLSDGDEVNFYLTNPTLKDTDLDGLEDGVEVNTTFTNPLLSDTDGDMFSDGAEVNLYLTDPNDAGSIPDALTDFTENFEGQLNLIWTEPVDSNANWSLSQDQVSQGSNSYRSGDIGDSQKSITEFSVLVTDGELSFDVLVLSEPCCDKLRVYLNDELMIDSTAQQWTNYLLSLVAGENTIRFEYFKDGSVSSLEDSVWIDNIIFTQQ